MFVPETSFAQAKEYENRYIILYVPAVYQKNHTAFISQPLYYTTVDKCRNDYDFVAKAKRAFSDYLKVNYSDEFPYGTQNFLEIKYEEHSSSEYLKTKQQTETRLNALKAKIVGTSNNTGKDKFIQTNFSYGCD